MNLRMAQRRLRRIRRNFRHYIKHWHFQNYYWWVISACCLVSFVAVQFVGEVQDFRQDFESAESLQQELVDDFIFNAPVETQSRYRDFIRNDRSSVTMEYIKQQGVLLE
jgi:hypothetical protein